MRNIKSSITVKVSQLCLPLVTLIIQRIDKEIKIKLKTVTKLAGIKGIIWWLPINITILLHQKSNTMQEYRLCKKNFITLINTYMEERSRELEKIGNNKEEARINYLLTTEKSRDKARRLKCLQPRSKVAGVNRLRIENPDVEGRDHIPPKDITAQSDLEKFLMN